MELLKKLTECASVSGDETAVRELIKKEVSGFVDEVYEDALGNLIVHKKGSGKKIMLAAHCDEIGVIVNFIDKNGFLRFNPVGGLYTKDLLGRRVRFSGNVFGVIGFEEQENERVISKMYIDIGTESREETEKYVKIGDMACFCGDFVRQNGKVISKALDNRAGCFVLIEALKRCNSENDLYFVFTVQEEVGLRGAKTSAFGIMPDIALAIDVTDTGDTPKSNVSEVALGKGAAIKVMDSSVMCAPEVRSLLIETAKKHNIMYQLEVLTAGGTDAGAIHLTGSGVRTGGISIPTRYIHSPSEMADIRDIEACIELAVHFCEHKI